MVTAITTTDLCLLLKITGEDRLTFSFEPQGCQHIITRLAQIYIKVENLVSRKHALRNALFTAIEIGCPATRIRLGNLVTWCRLAKINLPALNNARRRIAPSLLLALKRKRYTFPFHSIVEHEVHYLSPSTVQIRLDLICIFRSFKLIFGTTL